MLPGLQLFDDSAGEDLGAAVALAVVVQEKGGQWGDILPALPQRGQLQRNDVEAVVKVRPEGPGQHALLEVLVGGGQQAEVDLLLLHSSQPLALVALQHPEELALQSQRQGVDLVEEQRAAVGRLNKAGLAGIQGSGESALGIAEQLRLQQVLRQGGAVDLDDGGIGSAAVAVDVLGQHLLAGAGLAGDEDGGVRLGHLSGSLEDGLHGGTVCDDGLLSPCAFRGEGRHLDGAVVLIEDSLLIPLGQQIQPDGRRRCRR